MTIFKTLLLGVFLVGTCLPNLSGMNFEEIEVEEEEVTNTKKITKAKKRKFDELEELDELSEEATYGESSEESDKEEEEEEIKKIFKKIKKDHTTQQNWNTVALLDNDPGKQSAIELKKLNQMPLEKTAKLIELLAYDNFVMPFLYAIMGVNNAAKFIDDYQKIINKFLGKQPVNQSYEKTREKLAETTEYQQMRLNILFSKLEIKAPTKEQLITFFSWRLKNLELISQNLKNLGFPVLAWGSLLMGLTLRFDKQKLESIDTGILSLTNRIDKITI